jgi:C1A family cysteine protease
MRNVVPTEIIEPVAASSTQYLSVSANNYPASLDWRNQSIITSIKDQGGCGSCWAFGVTAYIESMLIKYKGYGQNVDLSEQYLLTCTPNSDCDGGYIKEAIKIASRGMPFNSLYAYNPTVINPSICSTTNKVNDLGSSYKYMNGLNDQQLIGLLQDGPVVVELSATGWEYYQRGIFQCPTNAVVNHVVLLIGYT